MKKVNINSYKDRVINAHDKVLVYRNLHENTLSIRKGNLVHGYAQMVVLYGVTFSVGKSGNEKANITKQKNVHAYVKGSIIFATDFEDVEATYKKLEELGYKRVYYNPFKVKTFVLYSTFEPIYKADKAIVIMDRVYIDKNKK